MIYFKAHELWKAREGIAGILAKIYESLVVTGEVLEAYVVPLYKGLKKTSEL